jgi:hypothetical protein
MLKDLRFSATALDTYLKCGLRFYYSHVLRLEEREESIGDIDRAGIGSFVHNILAEFYRPFLGKTLSPENLDRARLAKVIDNLFLQRYGEEEPGNQLLLKTQVQYQLDRFFAEYEIPRVSKGRVELIGVEQKIEIRVRGIEFRGRIDRIEKCDGVIHIRDFKTGADKNKLRIHFGKLDLTDRMTWSEAIGSLQLPFYSMLYRGWSADERAPVLPSYILLGKNNLDSDIELPLYENGTNRDVLDAAMEQVIFALTSEIMDEEEPFRPTEELDEHCPTCPYVNICGTAWVKRKRW